MKKKEFFKKIISVACIVMLLFFSFSTTFAKINSYYNDEGGKIEESKGKGFFETVFEWITGTILGVFGQCLAGIGYMVEVTVRVAVALLTFDKSALGGAFPWADRVIFNGMPLLDVNFINPEDGSLFKSGGSFTLVGTTVRNVYFTGMSIAVGFLGIVVAVMAIKLAISSIAAEKAKYKEAIVHWVIALVLVFGLHYVIAFIFYMNEQMVEIASSMVNGLVKANSEKIANTLSVGSFESAVGSVINVSPVESIGTYFRDSCLHLQWPNTETFISGILYCIFIVQSLMFFFAYLKRFFYVVILAIIGPFVAVYDFMQKAIS